MINLRINNELLSGLVGKVVAKIIQKKLGLSAQINPKDILVVVEGETTKIHLNADLSVPTKQLEELIKKNIF